MAKNQESVVDEVTLLSTSLVDRVTDRVREMILKGNLLPDEALNINAIAKQANVSLVPVREALARLSAFGLLQYTPNRGYRVTPRATPQERTALFEAREFLELSAAPLAVEYRTDEQIEELQELNQSMRKVDTIRPLVPRNFFHLNDKFHRLYVSTSANAYLVRFFDVLSFDLFASRQESLRVEIKRLTAEHALIIQALRKRDLGQLSITLQNHIRSTRYTNAAK
jgi:DNA-binding GntR family transcriptional regulator